VIFSRVPYRKLISFWSNSSPNIYVIIVSTHSAVSSGSSNNNKMVKLLIINNTCQEGLSEIETRYPEHTWYTILNPILEKFQSTKIEIKDYEINGSYTKIISNKLDAAEITGDALKFTKTKISPVP